MKKLIVNFFAHTPKAEHLDWKNIQSMLIRPLGTGLGDSVVLSTVFKQLKQAYPSCRLGVLATPRNRPILEHIPFIDEILPDTFWTALTHCGKYQVFLDYRPTFTTRNILFDFFLAPSYTICFEKKDKKYYSAATVHNYNFYVPDLSAAHLSQSLTLTPFAPYIDAQHPSYILTEPSQQAQQTAINFYRSDVKNILLCPFGTDRQVDPTLLAQLLKKLASTYKCHFICPFSLEKYPLNGQLPCTYTGPLPFEQFLALFKGVDLCLSVDSAPVHISCAYQTPLVGFYSAWERNFRTFAPISSHSAVVRSCTPANGPVEVIDNWSVEEAFEKATTFLGGGKK